MSDIQKFNKLIFNVIPVASGRFSTTFDPKTKVSEKLIGFTDNGDEVYQIIGSPNKEELHFYKVYPKSHN